MIVNTFTVQIVWQPYDGWLQLVNTYQYRPYFLILSWTCQCLLPQAVAWYNPLLTCWEDCWCHRFLWHCRQHQQRKFWDDKPLLHEQAHPSLPSVKRQPTAWFQSWKRRTLANRCTWFHLPFLQRICSKKQNPKRRNYTPESGLFLVFPCHSNPCEPILHGASSNRCSCFSGICDTPYYPHNMSGGRHRLSAILQSPRSFSFQRWHWHPPHELCLTFGCEPTNHWCNLPAICSGWYKPKFGINDSRLSRTQVTKKH